MRVLRNWMLLLALGLAPLPAAGQACGGFTDVLPSDAFCEDIDWLSNRNITVGCTATEYCPMLNVNRAGLAMFLRRLGAALKPFTLRIQDADFGGTYEAPDNFGCLSDDFGPVAYPREVSFWATLMNFNPSATKTIQGELVYSTDGGTTWNTTGDFSMWQTIDPAERTTLALVGGPLNLDVGSTYRFAIRAATNEPTATVQGQCQMNVRVESRIGTSPPF